jgi:hypothetical protein
VYDFATVFSAKKNTDTLKQRVMCAFLNVRLSCPCHGPPPSHTERAGQPRADARTSSSWTSASARSWAAPSLCTRTRGRPRARPNGRKREDRQRGERRLACGVIGRVGRAGSDKHSDFEMCTLGKNLFVSLANYVVIIHIDSPIWWFGRVFVECCNEGLGAHVADFIIRNIHM